jgi:hypothetical protein
LQSPKFPAASRLIRVAIFACARASASWVNQPIVEGIFSGAVDVVTNLDHVSIVTYTSQKRKSVFSD